MLTILKGENLSIIREFPSESVDLIYIDPPFNTGKTQSLTRKKMTRSQDGNIKGFGGHRYISEDISSISYRDSFDGDFMEFIIPRIQEAYRLLSPTGSLFFHIDPRESHYCKVELDKIFNRGSFMNEIVWSYDYGGRSKSKWSAKHDVIFWYAKDPENYTFNFDQIDRIPYLAPSLVGDEKAERGKTPTDVWWNTIVPTNGKERTGYPSQKPISIMRRIVSVHSNHGDILMDFFAGSGSFGEAAALEGRDCTLIDESPEAIRVMVERLSKYNIDVHTIAQENKNG